MTEIISIYFVLDGKVIYSLYSNLMSIIIIILYCGLFWDNLNSIQSFSNLIYLESLLLLLSPILFYFISISKLNKVFNVE
jgi:hypothetical protein